MNEFIHRVIFFDLGMTLVGKDTTQWTPGAQTLLTELRAANLRLGVISNTENLTRAQLEALLPPDFDWNIFETDLVLLSSEVGIKKPDLEIFRKAVERARVPAGQCLYCSEDSLETLAAQRVGIAAARIYAPPDDPNELPDSDLKKLTEALRKLARLH